LLVLRKGATRTYLLLRLTVVQLPQSAPFTWVLGDERFVCYSWRLEVGGLAGPGGIVNIGPGVPPFLHGRPEWPIFFLFFSSVPAPCLRAEMEMGILGKWWEIVEIEMEVEMEMENGYF